MGFISEEDVTRRSELGELVLIIRGKLLAGLSGQDVTELFEGNGAGGHAHSRAASSLLRQYHIGELAEPGEAAHADSNENGGGGEDAVIVDLSKPLLRQVGALGYRYHEWVHAPVPGQPRFFASEWAEAVTKVHWWVVPLLWLPVVAYSLAAATRGSAGLPLGAAAALLAAGVVLWQLIEYSLHRFLFHQTPTQPTSIFLHFLVHGCHHKFPMDVERLVFPPLPASWVALIIYGGVRAALPRGAACAVFAGIILGYVYYDCMHYFMHSGVVGGALKAAHMRHHYQDASVGFGISSPLFDWAWGTAAKPAVKRQAAVVMSR